MKLITIGPAPRLVFGFWNFCWRTFQRFPRRPGIGCHRHTCPGAGIHDVHGKWMGNDGKFDTLIPIFSWSNLKPIPMIQTLFTDCRWHTMHQNFWMVTNSVKQLPRHIFPQSERMRDWVGQHQIFHGQEILPDMCWLTLSLQPIATQETKWKTCIDRWRLKALRYVVFLRIINEICDRLGNGNLLQWSLWLDLTPWIAYGQWSKLSHTTPKTMNQNNHPNGRMPNVRFQSIHWEP